MGMRVAIEWSRVSGVTWLALGGYSKGCLGRKSTRGLEATMALPTVRKRLWTDKTSAVLSKPERLTKTIELLDTIPLRPASVVTLAS